MHICSPGERGRLQGRYCDRGTTNEGRWFKQEESCCHPVLTVYSISLAMCLVLGMRRWLRPCEYNEALVYFSPLTMTPPLPTSDLSLQWLAVCGSTSHRLPREGVPLLSLARWLPPWLHLRPAEEQPGAQGLPGDLRHRPSPSGRCCAPIGVCHQLERCLHAQVSTCIQGQRNYKRQGLAEILLIGIFSCICMCTFV